MTNEEPGIAASKLRPIRNSSFIIHHSSFSVFSRWLKFSAVGATGILVQSIVLALFLRIVGLHYLAATAMAVEASVLHNFIWHRRWTWRERRQDRLLVMLARFNLTNGALSLAGNLLLMALLVGGFGLNALIANFITIAICSLVNFALADRFVFV